MPYIKTSRLTLITFTVDMMKATLSGANQLKELTGYHVADGYPMEVYKIERFLQYPEENEWEGIIIHNKNRSIIGDMGFKGGPDEKGGMDLGYSIISGYQGNGYATEMASAMVEWGLNQPHVKKITASCSNENIPSIKVLRNTGFASGQRGRRNLLGNRYRLILS
ncbi:Protein N-acetyltransferase, RimJ/RimL family [Salinibacillus kushneri]|uniref:Protein N-acetyltransferase, RimJ/RimL family n=1 Tax=Salinibacillus kushneri TaxID=237682 RepID=A0A1I0DLI5_9BACI|nr:GNAT family N-acetyltransferase [Salinibacillus kushneri]SET32527.1 Protein N-acetyltransferase, RimJ/RimL family [Salinibacillus kushneri]